MIQNWDLGSHRDEKGEVRYTLFIDGTEADARVIAKKLGKYLENPTLAEPPFSYQFLVPNVVDEIHLERIRTAVQEGVENANRINQFVPGGVLGDPLFNNELDKTQTSFPTFFTLTPTANLVSELEGCEDKKELNLDDVTRRLSLHLEDVAPIQESTEEKPTDSVPEPAGNPPHHSPEEPSVADDQSIVSEEVASSQQPPMDVAEPLPEVPEIKNTQSPAAIPTNQTQTGMAADIAGLSFFAQPPQETKSPLPPVQEATQPTQTPINEENKTQASATDEKAEGETFPLNDSNMLIKDMEGTMLGDVELEDIFAAKTKMGNFIEIDKEIQQQQKQDKFAQTANTQPPEDSLFDVFAQDLKDQTNIIDLTKLHNKKQIESSAYKEADTEESLQIPEVAPSFAPAEHEAVQVDISNTPAKTSPENAANLPPQEATDNPSATDTQPSHRALYKNPVAAEDLPAITLRQPQKTPDFDFPSGTEDLPNSSGDLFHQLSDSSPVEEAALIPAETNTVSEEQENIFSEDSVEKKIKAETEIPAADETTAAPDEGSNDEAFVLPKTAFSTRKKNMQDNKKPILKLKPKVKIMQPPVPKPPVPVAPVAPTAAPHGPAVPPPTPLNKPRALDHSIQMPKSELKKHNWPLEIPLIPTYTLNNMVMSVNRFAHATAISVIEAPGKLYNPLVFHGASGTGKSHILNAMAFSFSQKFGQTNIFMTNGVRLSRGIQRYMLEGNIEKFDRFISAVKVLLIDDIHLLAINEQNRSYISKLLNTFLKEQKQIIITSKYPPESLEKLEELIKFRLDSGWISELKPATGQTHLKIVKKMLVDNRVDLTDTQIEEFFCNKDVTLGSVARSIRRLKVLENLLPPRPDNKVHSQAAILEKLIPSKGEDPDSLILSTDPNTITAITPRGNGEWGRIGIFYPQKYADRMNWMVFALQQRAKELGLEGGFDIVVRSSYATENIISSAFKIANLCDNKKLKGAIILGPRYDECDPSVRENFYDILTHMLEVMLIRCGVINEENVRLPSTYVEILSELMR